LGAQVAMNEVFKNFFENRTIICPDCHGLLNVSSSTDIICNNCSLTFPVVKGIPIILQNDSVFTADQVISSKRTFFAARAKENRLKSKIRRNLPALAKEYNKRAVDEIIHKELKPIEMATGLVIGAGIDPDAIRNRFPEALWLTTDVDLSFQPNLIADVLKLPIRNASFDIVVAEMVLEHTIDIFQAAQEIQRICKPGGIILVKVPFCFPWHGIPMDYFRCSPAGVRALFRSTEIIYLDKCMGPWGALAYQLDAVLINMTSLRYLRMGLSFVSRFLFGWLKYLDKLQISRAKNLISCAGITFVGRKTEQPLSCREIIKELQDRYDNL
jgi:uncharacterized protein YbaR (Trm112 family)